MDETQEDNHLIICEPCLIKSTRQIKEIDPKTK